MNRDRNGYPHGEFNLAHGPSGTATAVIGEGETTSGPVVLFGQVATHLHVPTGFSGAAVTFQASPDGETFQDVYDEDGTQISLAVTAGTVRRLPETLWGLRHLRFVSDTEQTAEVTLVVDLA